MWIIRVQFLPWIVPLMSQRAIPLRHVWKSTIESLGEIFQYVFQRSLQNYWLLGVVYPTTFRASVAREVWHTFFLVFLPCSVSHHDPVNYRFVELWVRIRRDFWQEDWTLYFLSLFPFCLVRSSPSPIFPADGRTISRCKNQGEKFLGSIFLHIFLSLSCSIFLPQFHTPVVYHL